MIRAIDVRSTAFIRGSAEDLCRAFVLFVSRRSPPRRACSLPKPRRPRHRQAQINPANPTSRDCLRRMSTTRRCMPKRLRPARNSRQQQKPRGQPPNDGRRQRRTRRGLPRKSISSQPTTRRRLPLPRRALQPLPRSRRRQNFHRNETLSIPPPPRRRRLRIRWSRSSATRRRR